MIYQYYVGNTSQQLFGISSVNGFVVLTLSLGLNKYGMR